MGISSSTKRNDVPCLTELKALCASLPLAAGLGGRRLPHEETEEEEEFFKL